MDILVRPYEELDYEDILAVTMQLWDLKMGPYTRRSIKINTDIIRDTGSIPKKINEGIFVAEVDGHIAGVVHADYFGKKISANESLSNLKLILKYGIIPLLKVQSMGKFFEHVVAEDELHIHGIVVSDKYRGLGIGSKIFEYLEEFCSKKKIKKLTLEVLNTNTKAHKLYKKLGFYEIKNLTFTKVQQKYFKAETHIYMLKDMNK